MKDGKTRAALVSEDSYPPVQTVNGTRDYVAKKGLGRTNNPDLEEIQLPYKAVSSIIGKESTSSIPVSNKDVFYIDEFDDLFNDLSSITSSSAEDDMNATTGSTNVSCFSGDMVTWWDLFKAVFVY